MNTLIRRLRLPFCRYPLGRPPLQRGRSIICFSSNDWSDIASSKSQIMRYLGRENTVLYVETIGIRHPRLSSHDLGRAIEKLKKGVTGLRHAENGVYLWSPLAIPYHGLPGVPRINSTYLSRAVSRHSATLGMRDPIVWSYLPNAADSIERLHASKIVYHCIDDYAEFTDAPSEAFRRMETRMLRLADITAVSSARLYELRQPDARRIAYVPHGVNLEEMTTWAAEDNDPPALDRLAHPRAGFVGRIADWIDLDLLARCAQELPHWSFVLVGPSNVDLSIFDSVPNVHWLGRKTHREVAQYIKSFDVCLMPFADNRVVDSVNPLKMYEYLALGKPVVSVPMREIRDFSHVVTIASASEFPRAIQAAFRANDDQKRRERIDSVSNRSWGDVAERIFELVDHPEMPLPSPSPIPDRLEGPSDR